MLWRTTISMDTEAKCVLGSSILVAPLQWLLLLAFELGKLMSDKSWPVPNAGGECPMPLA
jgi:hypothetical protein